MRGKKWSLRFEGDSLDDLVVLDCLNGKRISRTEVRHTHDVYRPCFDISVEGT